MAFLPLQMLYSPIAAVSMRAATPGLKKTSLSSTALSRAPDKSAMGPEYLNPRSRFMSPRSTPAPSPAPQPAPSPAPVASFPWRPSAPRLPFHVPLIANQMGAYMSFPAQMQGAMRRMAAINMANQAASLRLRELDAARAMERDRLNALRSIFTQTAPAPMPALPTAPSPAVQPGDVWNGPAAVVRQPQLPTIGGVAAPAAAQQQAQEQAQSAAAANRVALNLAGAPAEAAAQLAAAQQQEKYRQALMRLAAQIYGSNLNDVLRQRALAVSALG